jgi:hypothetical protein
MYLSTNGENYRRKMPFGKHKGTPLNEVPRRYLLWLKRQEWLNEPLRSEVYRVLNGIPEPTENERVDRAVEVHRLVRSFDDQLSGDR